MRALCTIILVLFLVGCATQEYGAVDEIDARIAALYIPQQYKVNLYADTASSGGARVLDIEYIVQDGQYVACEGSYTTSNSNGDQVTRCTRDTLRSGTMRGFTMEQVAMELQSNAVTLHKEGDCYADALLSFCFDENGALVSYVDMGRGGTQWAATYEKERVGLD